MKNKDFFMLDVRDGVDICPCCVEKSGIEVLITAAFEEGKSAFPSATIKDTFLGNEFMEFYNSIIDGDKSLYDTMCPYLTIDKAELDKILTGKINIKKKKGKKR